MPDTMKLPQLGEGVDEADVVRVLVSKGDTVEAEQALLEIETDKAMVEVPSERAGTIASVLVAEGDTIEPGTPIVEYESDDAEAGDEAEADPDEEEPDTEHETETEGEPDAEDEPDSEDEPEAEAEAEPIARPASTADLPIRAAPSARKLARTLGVDLPQLPGAAAGELISAADVRRWAAGGGVVRPVALPDFTRWGSVRREPMSRVRRVTAERMALSWREIPHVTLHAEADITALQAWRASQRRDDGPRITVTAVLVKLAAAALRAHPRLNASLDPQAEEIIYKDYVHIGVAVDTPRGLLVPVVRDADRTPLRAIAKTLADLAQRSRDADIQPEELNGATFTVTNLGGLGVGRFTPIINHPQAAVLGVGKAAQLPVWDDGEVQPRWRLPLSLSHDHRLVDGADGARFLQTLCESVRYPIEAASE